MPNPRLFSFERAIGADELNLLRARYNRIHTISILVFLGGIVASLFVLPTLFSAISDQVLPLVIKPETFGAPLIHAVLAALSCLTFLGIVNRILIWPFERDIAIHRSLRNLRDYEPEAVLKLATSYPQLEEYRQCVAKSGREFVCGDLELMQQFCDKERQVIASAAKEDATAAKEEKRAAIYKKLYRV